MRLCRSIPPATMTCLQMSMMCSSTLTTRHKQQCTLGDWLTCSEQCMMPSRPTCLASPAWCMCPSRACGPPAPGALGPSGAGAATLVPAMSSASCGTRGFMPLIDNVPNEFKGNVDIVSCMFVHVGASVAHLSWFLHWPTRSLCSKRSSILYTCGSLV